MGYKYVFTFVKHIKRCSQPEKLIQEMYMDNDGKMYNDELNNMETVCD